MAENHEPIPGPDQDFDTLQQILVAAVVLNAVTWNIPPTDVTALTDAQTPWTNTWAIAKNKLNATTTQRIAKDDARKDFEAVLRPFIQKWIYRNSSMAAEDVTECGLKPRDTERTPSVKVGLVGGIIVKLGIPLQILAECPLTPTAKYYGCILLEGGPLPAFAHINDVGQLIVEIPTSPPSGPEPTPTGYRIDFNEQRKKVFSNLKHDVTYYIYFYLVNAAGVSPLTVVESIKCV